MVVAEVFHKYEAYPEPASSVPVLPEQIEEGPVMVGVGLVPELIVILAVPEQPEALDTVTDHVPAAVGAIVSVVAPVFQ